MDEAIAQLITITATTPEIARQYVQLADSDVNQAVQLFFENGGADLAGGSRPAAPAPPQNPASSSRISGAGNAQNPIDLGDDDNISDDNDPDVTGYQPRQQAQADTNDDEAMARRLQEQMYGGNDEDAIRAPIARQSDTLLGPGSAVGGFGGGALDDAIQERMQAMQQRRRQGMSSDRTHSLPIANLSPGPRGIFNQRETSSIWNQDQEAGSQPSLVEATGGASEASARSNMLARLFQPPWDLMYKGSWEDARDEGKEHKKWLLVNIQDGSVFDCQTLNRDLWKNDGIVETVNENFVFLQYQKEDPRADPYIQFYFPQVDNTDMYPHVAIVDPRTGEQIKVWSRKIPSPMDFLMQLHEFLDRYSLESNARNPVAKRKSEAKKEKSLDEMTEEEQLQHAMQASMAAAQTDTLKPPPVVEDPDDLTRSIGDLRGSKAVEDDTGDAMSIYENGADSSSAEKTAFQQIPSDRPHSEPAAGPGITRVQIRHPGGRVVRRFAESDSVQVIYEFLKAEPLEGKEGAEFELVAMGGRNLLDSRHDSIEGCGLKNGTVMVEFTDS
jgi:UBX domain-containing protein 7